MPIHEVSLHIVNLVEKKWYVKVGGKYFFVIFCTRMANPGQIIAVYYTKNPHGMVREGFLNL